MKSKTIILSIHPCYIDKIFSGTKLYEYRKYVPLNINHIVVYATSPIKKIVAIIDVEDICRNSPDFIWRQTKDYSGITKDFFETYFRNREFGYAIKFNNVHKIDHPYCLSSIGLNVAPQSYRYIEDSKMSLLLNGDI